MRIFEIVLRRLQDCPQVVYDVETSGLDWKRNFPCGHVFTFGPNPADSYYVPVRHQAGGNVFHSMPPEHQHDWDGKPLKFETEFLRLMNRRGLTVVGHNLSFDTKFLWRLGMRDMDCRFEDTSLNAPLINEWQGKFSLEGCAAIAGVQAKKGDMIKEYIRSKFQGIPNREEMGSYWRLAGDDPMTVEYAVGDGTTTWQLWDWQMPRLEADELMTVWDVESRLIPVLTRMTCTGIKIDEERLEGLRGHVETQIDGLMSKFPDGFNARSPQDVKKWCQDHGNVDWPLTPKRQQPSFPEIWLETHDAGKQIVALRKLKTLHDSFIMPMRDHHVFEGRVHSTFNQLRGDEHGTITGRLSSSEPNLQQCVAKGSLIMVPGGSKKIEDITAGDWVYSYDDDLKLVLKRVTWAGKTGRRNVVRLHWRGNNNGSVRTGHLDVTEDHRVRRIDGQYMEAGAFKGGRPYTDKHSNRPSYGKLLYRGGEKVLALPRNNHVVYRVEPLSGEVDVYDITVEGTENFIANEICVHNCPKRNEKLGRLFRSIFVPDRGQIWGSADYSQCLVAGTQVMVPGGTKNIEDMAVGDLVYSYDAQRRLVLRKVTWAGQTGVKPVVRVKWATNGRTKGHLDVTSDHRIRLIDGTYKTVAELAGIAPTKKQKAPYHIRVMALRRSQCTAKGETRNYLWPTGTLRIKESRLVFEEVNGWSPEHVHHKDEDCLNDAPGNLVGLTRSEHVQQHKAYGMGKLDAVQRKERSLVATRALQHKFRLVNNHYITHIVPLEQVVPVYDITVEDTHNFIANEICVHNCEPRLLAFYSRCAALLHDYRTNPNADAHQAVADATGLPRQVGKQINQTLLTGGGKGVIVKKYGVPESEIDKIWNTYFDKLPEIRNFQKIATARMRNRRYIKSLLGRRCRIMDVNKSYWAVNRILQAGNADILKLKMVEIDDYLRAEGRPIDCLINIHDAIDYQFAPEHRAHYENCLGIMTDFPAGGLIELDVPMKVDAGEGPSWDVATYGPEKEELNNAT